MLQGASLGGNIWELEAHGVSCLVEKVPGTVSGYLFTDFAAAFPSMSHTWLFFVLEQIGLPPVLFNFLRSLYADSATTISFKG